ncbi:MMPL family transporter [Luteococcus sanguinis]|uniref:MMPL family transporter n=1 Tax=Luteococcus sanguinis TaxID=174038 RepID=A0ABW1X0Z5_9ACTN
MSHPRLRWLTGALVLVITWLAVAGVGGPIFGRISEVSSNDQTTFLPASSESTQVAKRLSSFLGGDSIPAVVVASRDDALTAADQAWLKALPAKVTAGVAGSPQGSPAITSEDGQAAQMFVPLSTDGEVSETVDELKDVLADGRPDGLEVQVTGPAGLTADLTEAFGGIDGILLGVALAAVFVILVAVYRSPLLPLLVLWTAISALCGAILVNFWLAKAGVLTLNGQVQGILFILVIGAATDYCLLLVSRYRDELHRHGDAREALAVAWRGVLEPVLASGGTVAAGLLCLLASDLNSNKALGPVAAIGIAFAVLGALTLLPALLALVGRAAFWPRPPQHDPAWAPKEHGIWARVAGLVARRARPVWVGMTVLLALFSLGLLGLKADGVPQSDLVLGTSQARDGQKVLAEHFPGGSGSPVQVIVPQGKLSDVASVLTSIAGVSSSAVVSADSPSGTIPLPVPTRGPLAQAAPTVRDGDVLVQATLAKAADSLEAEQTVVELRDALHAVDPAIVVGGETATDLDTNTTGAHDRAVILPLVLVVITLILAALLRAVVAPLVLTATTVLSFAAALGLSSLLFNHVLHLPGADPTVPLYGFVFLVALGVDYNIFLVTRVREESLTHGTREGLRRGLVVTGGVITSAGIVLAATFAALGVIPLVFLLQLAVIVALGVLMDTLLVRALLVPAIIHDLGRTFWWPSALSRSPEHADVTDNVG